MTRRDFILISDVLKKSKPRVRNDQHDYPTPTSEAEQKLWEQIVREFAAELKARNPIDAERAGFDAKRFMQMCGLEN